MSARGAASLRLALAMCWLGAVAPACGAELAPLGQVADTAALRALAGVAASVLREGAERPGDGGAMLYVHAANRCGLGGGDGDGGAEVGARDGGCWLAQFPAGGRDVRVWGARADASADATGALRLAIASLGGAGGTVLLPAGHFLLGGTLRLDRGSVTLRGAGKNVTVLAATGAAADVVAIGGAAFDVTVSDLSISGLGRDPRGGCAIAITDGVGNIALQNLRIGAAHHGVCMNNAVDHGVASLRSIDFNDMTGDTLLVDGASQIFLSTITSQQAKANPACLHLVSVGGFYVQNVTCGGSTYGLLARPPAGKAVFDGFISNLELDDSQDGGAGFSLDSSLGGKIWDIRATNVRAGFGRGVGLEFAGDDTRNIDVVNFTSNRNAREGILIRGLRDSAVADGQVLGNSSIEAGHPGVTIAGGTRLTMRDLRITRSYGGTPDSGQTYGIVVAPSFRGSARILGGDVSDNALGGLLLRSPSRDLVVRDLAGYNPVGPRRRDLGPSPWTYTAGSSPETAVLSAGLCAAIVIDGASMSLAPGATLALPLAAGQSMRGTCAINPKLTSLVQ